MPRQRDISFFHFRMFSTSVPTTPPLARGGVTACVRDCGDDMMQIGLAVCWPLDAYNKKLGRIKAEGLARKRIGDRTRGRIMRHRVALLHKVDPKQLRSLVHDLANEAMHHHLTRQLHLYLGPHDAPMRAFYEPRFHLGIVAQKPRQPKVKAA